MGGLGSGRFGRRSNRPLTDELWSIDVRDVSRSVPPLSATGCSEVGTSGDNLPAEGRVLHLVRPIPGDMSYAVSVVQGPRTQRVPRWWLVCPTCTRPREKLFSLRWGCAPLACRVCLGARYRSQRLTHGERLAHRAAVLYQRAGCSMGDDWLRKPEGMSITKFDRLISRAQAYEEAWIDAGLGMFIKRLARRLHRDFV